MQHEKIRLIVSDIDGTLQPKQGVISETTRAAIRACRDHGILFSLASGRWFPSTVSVAEELGTRGPLIVANGACIITPDGEILQEFPMEDADALRAWSILKGSGAMVTSYVRGAIYRLNTRARERKLPEKHTYFDGELYEVVDDDPGRFENEALTAVYKMEAYSDDLRLLARLKTELEGQGLDVSSSFRDNLEVTSTGLGKGNALRWLGGYLKIPVSSIMAFGDNTNDLGMIEAAGVGVAMGDGADLLKQHADMIAPPCAEDGLARVLKERVFGETEE